MEDQEKIIKNKQAYVQENFAYYKTEWERMNKGKSSFNLAAFFIPILWLGYRKMYKPIIVIALLYLVITILNITDSQTGWLRFIDAFYTLMISFFCGFLGNTMYKKQTEIQVEAVLNDTIDQHDREKKLNKRGGVSGVGILIAVLLVICTYTIPMIIVDFTLL